MSIKNLLQELFDMSDDPDMADWEKVRIKNDQVDRAEGVFLLLGIDPHLFCSRLVPGTKDTEFCISPDAPRGELAAKKLRALPYADESVGPDQAETIYPTNDYDN